MKAQIFVGILMVYGCLFCSCQNEEMLNVPEEMLSETEEMVQLKSATGSLSLCASTYIPLITGQNSVCGDLIIGNTIDMLNVSFVPNSSHTLLEVHLWIGTEMADIPINKSNIPVPGKFPYKGTGFPHFTFSIDLTDICEDPQELLEGKDLYVVAHTQLMNNDTGLEESAWSAGEQLSANGWSMCTSYKYCISYGGTSGCLPGVATCGMKIDDEYYFNNKKGGDQIIYVQSGEVAGTVEYSDGKFHFNFSQNWMFTDLLDDPVIEIFGYDEPCSIGAELYSGPPIPDSGPYAVDVPNYPYYQLELNVQQCR